MAIGRFNLSLTGVQPGGLVYVGGTTFSAASTVSLDNVFSSTYQNYKIIIAGSNSSTLLNWQMRLRASGTDSTASYFSSEFWVNVFGSTGVGSYINNGSFWQINTNDAGQGSIPISFDILRPNEATPTNIMGFGYDSHAAKAKYFGGLNNASTSYDGFTILPNTGNISGTVRVYGYRNDNN